MVSRAVIVVRPRSLLTAVAISLVAPHAVAAQAPFSLEQILSSPFPSELVSAPRGGLVAWVRNAEGVRNIWVATAPDYQGRQVTSYTRDDGQEISGLAVTPDGGTIVYVRGGAPNRRGEIPNPTSAPAGQKSALWAIAVDGGEPRFLADGSAPQVSPRGDGIAYIAKGEIWTVALDSAGEPAKLASIRGGPANLRWSPDGSMLAFVSTRGDHAFVGVYRFSDSTVRYLDPSVDRDGSPTWSPDSRNIAFIRVPNARDRLPFFARREAAPWSIHVADVAHATGREVWRAATGQGSAFQGIAGDDQLLWGADDRLVFPWERDGWLHLYSVPARGGGEAALLTPGAFEVEHVTLSAGGDAVIYSSNQDDIDRRHLWRVPVTGGRSTALTSGNGIEWSPVVASEEAVAFLASDARTPAHAEILHRSTRRALVADWLPPGFPMDELVEPRQVVFAAADGMRIHGQLFVPRNLAAGEQRPAVSFFHGGSRRQMLLGWHYLDYYHHAYGLNQYLAARGFVVLSVNYRSGTGYGLEFREAIDYGAGGASEFNDVLGAGLYLRNRADVRADRIGLWGGSYGGYLTALGLARASDLFAAGVDIHGVHDWNVVIENFVSSYDPADRPELASLAFRSSPLASVDTWRSPVLVIHGDDDRNVPFSETVDLVESLRKREVEVEQLVFPDEVHGFLLHRNWLAAYRAVADFLERKLAEAGVRAAR